jgi:hypothetical protein
MVVALQLALLFRDAHAMGINVSVASFGSLADALARLDAAGTPCQLVMVDGALVMPSAPPPDVWTEVRLRAREGMVTLRRQGTEVAVIVFGNATPQLLAMRDRIAGLATPQ